MGGVFGTVAETKFSLNASSELVQVVVVPSDFLQDVPPLSVELKVLISHQLDACVAPVFTAASPNVGEPFDATVLSGARFE